MGTLKYWIVISGFLVGLAGCENLKPTETATQGTMVGANFEVPGSVVEVFYGTDRNLISKSVVAVDFGTGRSSDLFYGSCFVSVPPDHEIGVVERPWFKWVSEKSEKHMMLVAHNDYKNFAEFAGAIKSQPKEKMFVFIHGYNVMFNDAAFRTAQMAYDLRFDGTPVFFSWPSTGGIISYTHDENNIEWAIFHIAKFLEGLIKDVPGKDIYIIAHSMGTRGASRAISAVLASNPDAASRIKEVILAAPDIDADVFKDQIMPIFSNAQLPITMYTSDQDKALLLSSLIHGYVRAGSGLPGAKNLEVIDVPKDDLDFLGHSYFSENVPILNDLHYLIEKNLRADSRSMLRKVDTENGSYWVLKK